MRPLPAPPTMALRISDLRIPMPPKSDHPGLKWRATVSGRQPYWVAAQVTRDTKEFPDKTIRLPANATEDELADLCRLYTVRLLKWIADCGKGTPAPRYDGTVHALSQLFQRHPESSFHSIKQNTRDSYVDSLKIIEHDVGARVVRNLTIIDVKRWYRNWRQPAAKGKPERIKRAHDAVAVFRMILRWGFACGHEECGKLDDKLATIRFEKSGAREQEMTFAQAAAFVRKALEMGKAGVIPWDRARSMAIGVAAQFDLLLRQKDIIGEWTPAQPGAAGAIYDDGGEMWTGRFRWDNLPGWRLRLKTSKTRSAIEFDLQNYSLLFPLLESVPLHERIGAIVNGEHGLPVRERSYRKWFRQIARAAGIPDDVWSMDSRAGGATEADEAGADLKAISDHLTHSETRTTVRYIRRVQKRTAGVAEARNRKRVAEGGARRPDNSQLSLFGDKDGDNDA
jgi:hypothetical protein